MPQILVEEGEWRRTPKMHRKAQSKVGSRESRLLTIQLEHYQALYEDSQISKTINRQLRAIFKTAPPNVKNILSLGLGSLHVVKDQSRRLKQLALLLKLRDTLQEVAGTAPAIHAQDPTFSKADEMFLSNLGISILRTPSGSELGEASRFLHPSTMIFSPFLTLEAYEQLLGSPGSPIRYIFGDDFNALLSKWPKYSPERKQVERVVKGGISQYRRRAVEDDGFWDSEDNAFPMALYERRVAMLPPQEKARL
jgi:hypothetical protein